MGLLGRQDGLANLIPDATEQNDSEIKNGLATRFLPTHSREFHSLREDRFTCRFSDSAADGKPEIPVLCIVHESRPLADVGTGDAIRFLLGLA